MKRLLVLVSLLALAFPTAVFAKSSKNFNKTIFVGPDEVIEGDFIAAGDRIDIYGTVKGDVYVAGGIVNIDGTIEGDVLAAGGEVTISGNIGQDLRAAAGTLTINGTVEKNITIAGGYVDIAKGAKLNRNVYLAAGNFYLAGSINGDLTYASDPESKIAETASISGAISKHEFEYEVDQKNAREAAQAFGIFTKFISLISTLIFGLLLIKILPRSVKRASELVKTSFWKSLLAGFLTLVLGPIFTVLSFVSIVGFPIGISLVALFIVYGFIARIYVMIAFGKKVEELTKVNLKGTYYHFGLGLVVYYLLILIPFFGGLIKLAVVTAGLGAAIRNIRNTYYLGISKKIL